MRPPLAFISGLSPAWLLVGVAGAVAVLVIHAIGRRRAPSVLFPAAALIASSRASGTTRRSSRLTRWLLAALRALCVLLIALAFDRPSLVGAGTAEDGGRRVIVLDVSASMATPAGGVTRAERAADIARRLVEGQDPARTPTALLLAGAGVHDAAPGFAANRAALLGAIDNARTCREAADLEGAVTRARAILGGAGAVHVITDGQHEIPDGVAVHLVDTASDAPNRAVSDLRWTPTRPVAGDRVTLSCRVIAHGADQALATVRFTLADMTASVDVDLDACSWSTASATFVLPAGVEGRVEVSAAVDADAFPADDRASATLDVPPALRVVTLGDTEHIALALSPPGVRSRYAVSSAGDADDVLDAEAVLCGPGVPYTTRELDALEAAWRRGAGVLWIAPFDGAWDALEAWSARTGTAIERGVSPFRAEGLRTDGPPFAGIDGSDLLADIAIERVTGVARVRGWRPALIGSAERPIVMRSDRAGLLLFDPAEPGVVASPALPVLSHELLRAVLEDAPSDVAIDAFPAPECACVRSAPGDADADATTANATTRTERERPLAPYLLIGVLVLLGLEGVASALVRGRGT